MRMYLKRKLPGLRRMHLFHENLGSLGMPTTGPPMIVGIILGSLTDDTCAAGAALFGR